VKSSTKKRAILCGILAGLSFSFAASLLLSRPLLISTDIAQASDAIIVIGGDHKPERVRRAVELYQMGYAPRVIISGGTIVFEGNEELAEAELMRRQALSMGLPEATITIEARSKSTFENAFYSKQICRENGLQSILLVTSAFHSKRAKTIFQDVMAPDIAVRVQPALEPCQVCGLFDPSDIYVVFYEYQNWIRYWFEQNGYVGAR
jgi:uncharacterized SAM-binding protein YcdF (DUF218 family)